LKKKLYYLIKKGEDKKMEGINEMDFPEYARKMREVEEKKREIEEQRVKVRKEALRAGFAQALNAAGLDPSWAQIVALESEADYPALIGALRARGVTGKPLDFTGIGSRLAAIQNEANKAVEAADTFFLNPESERSEAKKGNIYFGDDDE